MEISAQTPTWAGPSDPLCARDAPAADDPADSWVVLTLNGVDRDFGHNIETITPEELGEYIEEVLANAGLDVGR